MANKFTEILNIINWDNVFKEIGNRDIILWGASQGGKTLCDFLRNKGANIKCFIDNNKDKIGCEFNTLIINPLEILDNSTGKYYIFICTNYYKEVEEVLNSKGYEEQKDYFYFFHKPVIVENVSNYSDVYGNKINGNGNNCKVTFVGYNSEITIGDNTVIEGLVIDSNDSKINIGSNCVFEKNVYIEAVSSKIDINDNCHIVERVVMRCKDDSILTIENNCLIGYGTNILVILDSNLFIGKYTTSEWNVVIESMNHSIVKMGNDCMISYFVSVQCDDVHPIYDNNNVCINDKNRFILIGNHVWLGSKSTLLHGTKIGDNSIVGASSVVKGEFPNNCTMAGIPSKIIKTGVSWEREFKN